MNRIAEHNTHLPVSAVVNSGIGPARITMLAPNSIEVASVGRYRSEDALVVWGRYVVGALRFVRADESSPWVYADEHTLRYDHDNDSEGLPRGKRSRCVQNAVSRVDNVAELVAWKLNASNAIAAQVADMAARIDDVLRNRAVEAAARVVNNRIDSVEATKLRIEFLQRQLEQEEAAVEEAAKTYTARTIERDAADEGIEVPVATSAVEADGWADMFAGTMVNEDEADALNAQGREALAALRPNVTVIDHTEVTA